MVPEVNFMDIRHFRTFKCIVEVGSFSAAAARLGYTQSTITSQMQQLEQELSLKLFEKIGRNMVLTPFGRELIPYVNDLLDAMKRIENIGHNDGVIQGELRIAVVESLMTYKLQDVLREFKQQAPQAKLSFLSLSAPDARSMLLKGQVDIGLLYDLGTVCENLETVQLASYPLTLVASPLLEKEQYDFSQPHQSLTLSFLINEVDCTYRQIFEGYLRKQDISLDSPIELGSVEAIKKCVASNLGISFLPRFTVEEELSSGKLQEVPCVCNGMHVSAVFEYHKNRWISPAMALFISLLQKNFQDFEEKK